MKLLRLPVAAVFFLFSEQLLGSYCIFCPPFFETEGAVADNEIEKEVDTEIESSLKKKRKTRSSPVARSKIPSAKRTKPKYDREKRWQRTTIDRIMTTAILSADEKSRLGKSIYEHFKFCLERAKPASKGRKMQGRYILNLNKGLNKLSCGGFVEYTAKTEFHFQENSLNIGISKPYIGINSIVAGEAELMGDDIYIRDNAVLSGNVVIFGNSVIKNNARVSGSAWVENSVISGHARVYGNSWVYGGSEVSGYAKIFGRAHVTGGSFVSGNTVATGDTWIAGGRHTGKIQSFTSGIHGF